jgi:hypothetical protein
MELGDFLRRDDGGEPVMGHAASWQVPAVVPRGVILGSVVLADVVDDSCSPWAEPGCKHWLLRDPHLWPDPVPAKGDLGLWNYPRE